MVRAYPLASISVWRLHGNESPFPEFSKERLEAGLFRRELGTTTCPICGHYTFLKDDVKKILDYRKYQGICGIKVNEKAFWLPKTLLAPAACRICNARYLLFLTKDYSPYNMCFFYSSGEVPSLKDLEAVPDIYMKKYDDSFRVSIEDDEMFDVQAEISEKVLDKHQEV